MVLITLGLLEIYLGRNLCLLSYGQRNTVISSIKYNVCNEIDTHFFDMLIRKRAVVEHALTKKIHKNV